MDLLRGPQALLSSAIAEALSEFFVVGVDQIESDLLAGSKIILKDVRLKPQCPSIPKNAFGTATELHITGFVREVSLTWSWDLFPRDKQAWVKDAALKLKGCRFKVKLSQVENTENDDIDVDIDIGTSDTASLTNVDSNETPEVQDSSSFVETTVDDETPQNITIEERIKTFLDEQIEFLVNSLALTIEDFDIILEMPSPNILTTIPGVSVFEDPEDEEGNIEMSFEVPDSQTIDIPTKSPAIMISENLEEEWGEIEIVEAFEAKNTTETENTVDFKDYTISLKLAGEEMSLLSFGKYSDGTLKERISLSSVFINVTETFHHESTQKRRVECKTYPLLETFSFHLGITRTHGERFSDIGRGLIVKGGLNENLTTPKNSAGKLSLHLCRPQLEAIGQLSGLTLAPPEENAKNIHRMESDDSSILGDVTRFHVFFGDVDADILGNSLWVNNLTLCCLLDGSDLTLKGEKAHYEEAVTERKPQPLSIKGSKIVASVLPSLEVTLGSITELYVPDIVELRSPVENVLVKLVGQTTWTVDIDVFDGYLPLPDKKPHDDEDDNEIIPIAVVGNVKKIFLCKDEDEEVTEVAFVDVEILVYPKTDESGTELAVTAQSMQSKLASATNIHTCMVLPERDGDTNMIRDFAFSLDQLSVTAGYTIQDWKKTFRFGGRWRRAKHDNKTDEAALFRLPNAVVAPLKTRIAYNAMEVVSLKETTFVVKGYKGNKNTTVKDLLEFYTAECLSRTPNFLQNAELLGINVKSAGVFGLGAHFIATPIGPFVGVAAVVGVDAVRASIEAGKRGRQASEDDYARVSDFFRGIGYSAVEATQLGKLRRGAEDRNGNILDWMVGATANTSEYIGNNKDTLGSAGGAGVGVLVGTLLAGPVGAAVGGLVAGMTTGSAIRRIDQKIKTVLERREIQVEQKRIEIEEKSLKPGQLALSPASDSGFIS